MFMVNALLAIALFPFPDSTVTLRSCGRPREPIGILRSSGDVAFLLDRRGRVLAENIRVLSVTGSSAAGFRSALERQLPVCRFEPNNRVDRWIRGTVTFNGYTLSLHNSFTVEFPPDSSPPSPISVLEQVYDESSPALDEAPRIVDCQAVAREEITTRTRIDGQVVGPPPMSNLPPPRETGEVRLSYVVMGNGRIQQGSFILLGQNNPDLVSRAVALLQTCRFAPGRIGGRKVSVKVATIQRF